MLAAQTLQFANVSRFVTDLASVGAKLIRIQGVLIVELTWTNAGDYLRLLFVRVSSESIFGHVGHRMDCVVRDFAA